MKKGRKFGMKRGERQAFLRILAGNLVMRRKITTTEARAKEIRPVVERYVTYAKKQDVASLRMLMTKLPKPAVYALYHDIAPKYAERKGGYTRITKLTLPRKHDAAPMAVIEFV
jgi:large subunit ribosomal protein L17